MAQVYVVANDIGLYLKNWTPETEEPEFGVIDETTNEFETLEEANDTASIIGSGTVGTTKP